MKRSESATPLAFLLSQALSFHLDAHTCTLHFTVYTVCGNFVSFILVSNLGCFLGVIFVGKNPLSLARKSLITNPPSLPGKWTVRRVPQP